MPRSRSPLRTVSQRVLEEDPEAESADEGEVEEEKALEENVQRKIWSFTTWELFQDLPPNIRGSGSFNPYCLLLSLLRDTAVMKKGSVASTRCFKLKYAKNTKIRGNEYIQGPCAQAAR